jgi:hypothetical protein
MNCEPLVQLAVKFIDCVKTTCHSIDYFKDNMLELESVRKMREMKKTTKPVYLTAE